MNALTKSRFSWLHVIVAAILLFFAFSLFMASTATIGERGHITRSIANCRQIILSFRLYADDHAGAYPDVKVPSAKNSNAAFRQLFVEGTLEDEKIFGCGASPFEPDGRIGDKPDYPLAVAPGENHWAMTKGLNVNSPGEMPLVYENPVDSAWPPKWNADAAARSVKGRSWPGGKVIIGTNDTSVELMKLESSKGTSVPLKPMKSDGLSLFDRYSSTPDNSQRQVLDVAVTHE